jgi:hypothetical protein
MPRVLMRPMRIGALNWMFCIVTRGTAFRSPSRSRPAARQEGFRLIEGRKPRPPALAAVPPRRPGWPVRHTPPPRQQRGAAACPAAAEMPARPRGRRAPVSVRPAHPPDLEPGRLCRVRGYAGMALHALAHGRGRPAQVAATTLDRLHGREWFNVGRRYRAVPTGGHRDLCRRPWACADRWPASRRR